MKWGVVIPAVFVGSKQERWGEFDRVMNLVRHFGMENEIKYLGVVSNKEMIVLYSTATALVMPTFFGPTNIPPIEAFNLGCPVITSNIRGIREQVGNAAILVNPRNPEEIAEAIYRVSTDINLRRILIEKGYKKAKDWTLQDFSLNLHSIIDECCLRLSKDNNIYQEEIYLPKEIVKEGIPWRQEFQTSIGLWNYYLSEGNDVKAERSFKEAISIKEVPEQVKFYLFATFGSYYLIQKRYKEAEEKFKETLSIREVPRQQIFHAILGLANCYSSQGKYTEAEERFNEALSLEVPPQTRFQAILGLGNCYSSQGKHKEAEERFKEALTIEEVPNSSRVFVYYNLGSMYERKGDYAKAIDKFKTVLTLAKDIKSLDGNILGNAHFHLGCIYQTLGEKERAKSEFENCLKLNPNHKKAKEKRAELCR
jgi:tetratricopeptide (TPR) repeat protein